MTRKSHTFITLLIILTFIHTINSVKLERGQLSIVVSQEHKSDQKLKLNINSKIKSALDLTQSSRVNIQAKLEFNPTTFIPEFFSFRLRHPVYDNLTEPVLAKYDQNEQLYTVTIDLGDPNQIKPFSDKYQLQVIIADENLDQNVRHIIADCNISFRKSLQSIPNSELHYVKEKIIETLPPTQREDPPKIFTLFVILLVIVIDLVFFFGLSHLNVNVRLFPKSSSGFLMNMAFLAVLMANLAILFKFWINWTFLETLQYLLVLLLPTALISNYAFVHIRKQ